jgi:hypothetical protein
MMKTQWQDYRSLELIPDSVPEPAEIKPTLKTQLKEAWRKLLAPFDGTLDEEPYEYLERCLELDCSKLYGNQQSGFWQNLQTWFGHSLFDCRISQSPEPEVWQTTDRSGNLWWHVYDPLTGQTADLESEEAVQIWLDDRLSW